MKRFIKLSQGAKYTEIHEYFSSPLIFQKTSDVTIFCEDGVYFAHKLVMASISSFLSSLLQQNSLDKDVSLIIPGFSVPEVSTFFKNLYNGRDLQMFHGLLRVLGIFLPLEVKSEYLHDVTEYLNEDGLGKAKTKGWNVKKDSNLIDNALQVYENFMDNNEDQDERIDTLENTVVDDTSNITQSSDDIPEENVDVKDQLHERKYEIPISEHFERSSSDNSQINCKYCDKTLRAASSKCYADNHVLNAHKDLLSEIQLLDLQKDIQTPDPNKVRYSKSLVWNYFQRIPGVYKAQCSFCKVILGCKTGSTSGLRNHLTNRHSEFVSKKDLDGQDRKVLSYGSIDELKSSL